MRLSILALVSGLLPLVITHPLEKRQDALPPVTSAVDESVLQLVRRFHAIEFLVPLISTRLSTSSTWNSPSIQAALTTSPTPNTKLLALPPDSVRTWVSSPKYVSSFNPKPKHHSLP